MTLTGSTPRDPRVRRYGSQRVSVRQVRTQNLQPGDVVLHHQQKCTVTSAPRKRGAQWELTLQLPNGSLRSVNKYAGIIWPVLDNTQQPAV